MKRRSAVRLIFLLPLVALVWVAAGAGAATYVQPSHDSPFATTGFIQAATLDTPGDVLSGGSATINGQSIVVPRNTILQMPATGLTWQELWSKAPLPWGLVSAGGNGQTGLALSDSFTDTTTGAVTRPLTTFEITVQGNRILNPTRGDIYVAGLISISQQSLNFSQGVINYIDYATGELHVGGAVLGGRSATDVILQVNDPVGRFGRIASPDERFTADTDNPTVRSATGYPMCIPRTRVDNGIDDPQCPQKNRPRDPASTTIPQAMLGNFTEGPNPNTGPIRPGAANALAQANPLADPTLQAPFEVGDYITYSGALEQDPTVPGVAGQYISAWEVIASLGIYTSPGKNPAYVAMELTLQGVGGLPINSPIAVPQEQTTRIKTLGFFTDPTRTIDLFAVQVDPCSGAETDKLMLGSIPNQRGGVPWGRFRDVDQQGLFPVTREWRARYTPVLDEVPPPPLVANGLLPNQYRIPVAEFITPENLVFGDPTLLAVPNNFQDFPFLVNGSGPWRGDKAHIAGQLTPFPLTNSIPGLTPPAPPSAARCGPPKVLAPTAAINPPNQTVSQGTTVTLDARTSVDPNSPPRTPLKYAWFQTSGPVVGLALPPAPAPQDGSVRTFRAPPVLFNTPLTFQLTVTNSAGLSATAVTQIMDATLPQARDTVVITNASYRISRGILTVSAGSSSPTCAGILTLSAALVNGKQFGPVTMAITPPGCTYSYTTPRSLFPSPVSVTVRSSLGGTATSFNITFQP